MPLHLVGACIVQGWKTYAVAVGVAVHGVGMQAVLWHTMPVSWHLAGSKQADGAIKTGSSAALPLRALTTRL